jgi:hypothetical protein
MFVKLPRIQRAAIDFLHSTFTDQDRAFVVDFDTEPRLARGTTTSLDRLIQSITGLQADGRTALWESIVFSLVQLQEVRGRKALIVFSDGADEDDQFPFRSAADVAKRMGVPIYLILMKSKPEESIGLSLFSRSFTSRINRLVEATGGRVFYAKEYQHLDEVYEEIESELRSQYLLAYYPSDPGANRAWRKVDVEVDQRVRPSGIDGCAAMARELLAGTWSARHGLGTVAVRVGFVYGPGADVGPNGSMAIASAAAIDNRPYALAVDGTADLQFVGDVAAAMCNAARSGSGARVVNVVGEVGSIGDVVEILSACTGAADLSVRADAAQLNMALARRTGDAAATLPTGLADGVRATVEAVRWAPRDFAHSQRPITPD